MLAKELETDRIAVDREHAEVIDRIARAKEDRIAKAKKQLADAEAELARASA